MAETIVIVGAKRTPIGSMQGKFNSVTASQLGAVAIKAAIVRWSGMRALSDSVHGRFNPHLSAAMKQGKPFDFDGRDTVIWEKRGGRWLIVHEHVSAPLP